jgi:hypothetical protein
MNGPLKWAIDNPIPLALGVFAVGAVLLLVLRKPTVIQDSGMGAFYAAQSAGAQSGNELAKVQAQVAGATAIAGIAAKRDETLSDTAGRYSVQLATVGAQTSLELAGMNKEVELVRERTKIEAQNKAYWQGVGQNALQGQALPYLLQGLLNPSTSAGAASVLNTWAKYASQFWDANAQRGNTA